MTGLRIYRRILVGLAVVLLVCAVKNYLAVLLTGTRWCAYLCPSAFEWAFYPGIWPLEHWFALQRWLLGSAQRLGEHWFSDPWALTTRLVAAPILEEVLYRGPLYLARRYSRSRLWWLAGGLLVLLFAFGHGRSGVALLPLLTLGVYNLWLVAATRRLWPAIALHFLYNFFFTSVLLYGALWASD